jgi:hypothetical protein
VLLICEKNRTVHEVVAKLTPAEVERVVDIVRQSPDHFPSGTLAALKSHSPTPARRPTADSVPADQATRRSTTPQSGKELRQYRQSVRHHAGSGVATVDCRRRRDRNGHRGCFAATRAQRRRDRRQAYATRAGGRY